MSTNEVHDHQRFDVDDELVVVDDDKNDDQYDKIDENDADVSHSDKAFDEATTAVVNDPNVSKLDINKASRLSSRICCTFERVHLPVDGGIDMFVCVLCVFMESFELTSSSFDIDDGTLVSDAPNIVS
jgi:hypothetical protein